LGALLGKAVNQPLGCKFSLEAEADPTRMAFGFTTPRHLAFAQHRDEMAGWLLGYGADPFSEKRFVNDKTTPFELDITASRGSLSDCPILCPGRSTRWSSVLARSPK